jgi:hypothetical protein
MSININLVLMLAMACVSWLTRLPQGESPIEPAPLFSPGIHRPHIELITVGQLITANIYLPVIMASTGSGKSYFVATTGNDAAPGTFSQPWRTLQQAASTLQPGDTVYVRGGVYPERLTITVSGSAAGGYITYRNYAQETPILDGSGLTVPAAENGMILIDDQSYLVIRGFEIRNYRSNIRDRVPVGIHVRGAAHHLQLLDNRINNIASTAVVDGDLRGRDAHGIAVYGTKAPVAINNITISGNELHQLTLGSSEALVLNGNVELFTVTNNLIHDADNIGLDFIGYEQTAPDPAFDQVRNGRVSGNTIYNIDTLTNPAYGGERSAGGIYVDGGTNLLIEQNRVFSANIGIEIASEHQGRATSFITVRNNLVYHNHIAGLAMGGYDARRGSTENCTIVNNTFYHNDTTQNGNGELLIQFDTRNNVIKNNIFQANSDQSLLIGNIYAQNTGNVLDYNLYYAPAGRDDSEWQWKNVTYQGFTAYQTGSGNDAHSQFSPAEFIDAAAFELHLQAASPAIDQGQNLSEAGAADFDGDARILGGQIDIGADERE